MLGNPASLTVWILMKTDGLDYARLKVDVIIDGAAYDEVREERKRYTPISVLGSEQTDFTRKDFAMRV